MYKVLSSGCVEGLNEEIKDFQKENTVFSMQFQVASRSSNIVSTIYSVLVEYRPKSAKPEGITMPRRLF